jgi:hypothetical protein
MKKIEKSGVMSTSDDFPMTERHIHFLRIRAFSIEGIKFTEKENAHFDICRVCRLKVIDAVKNLGPQVHAIMQKAA